MKQPEGRAEQVITHYDRDLVVPKAVHGGKAPPEIAPVDGVVMKQRCRMNELDRRREARPLDTAQVTQQVHQVALNNQRRTLEQALGRPAPTSIAPPPREGASKAPPRIAPVAARLPKLDAKGRIVASQLHYPRTATTLWWPGEDVVESTLIGVPAHTPPGQYALKVAMFLPENPGRRILLGIEGRDGDDRYELCLVQAVAGARQNGIVYEQHFEGTVVERQDDGPTVLLALGGKILIFSPVPDGITRPKPPELWARQDSVENSWVR